MIKVNVESPCRGKVPDFVPRWMRATVERVIRMRNHMYALDCMRDCLRRGEAPYASHVLFDVAGVLRDAVPHECEHGMACGDVWAWCADYHVFYCDHGMSPGMQRRWDECVQAGRTCVERYLYGQKGAANDNANQVAA